MCNDASKRERERELAKIHYSLRFLYSNQLISLTISVITWYIEIGGTLHVKGSCLYKRPEST